jgi:hypothetical protein
MRARLFPKPALTTTATAKTNRGADIESTGRWYFKRDILDRLGDYFAMLRVVRHHDPDGYEQISKMGAVVINVREGGETNNNETTIGGHIGFGAVYPVTERQRRRDGDKMDITFGYWLRHDTPPATVEPTNGTVFELTVFYPDRKSKRKKGFGVPLTAFVGVVDGEPHLLRQVVSERYTINERGPRTKQVKSTRRYWGYPRWLSDIIPASAEEPLSFEDARDKYMYWFGWAYNAYRNASMDTRVAVKSRGLVAAFSVDLLRMPYFFADRDTGVLVNGRRKKIFHIVRTHTRRYKSGREVFVRSHFRGLRVFGWNGYRVRVTMPGKHHPDMLDLDFGGHDPEMSGMQEADTHTPTEVFDAIARVAAR